MELAEELVYFFEKKKKAAAAIDRACVAIVEGVADLTLRPSKRVRPYLVRLGYQLANSGNFPRALLDAMLGVELFHTFALIHDDIMDEDVQRRGGPTVHEKFKVESLKFKVKNAKRFGESMAILAGDLALVWADECMSKTQNIAAIDLYFKMKEEVVFGQTLDIMKQAGYKKVSQEKINKLKTAWYTVVRPLQIGAALAGAGEQTLKQLALYGVPVGKLFQLKDDLLDKEITKRQFDQLVGPLEKEAQEALAALDISLDIRKSFEDFARFVIERIA